MTLALQEDLKELYMLDKQVRGLRSRLDAATRRRDAQQTKLDQLTRQSEELAAQLKQTQARANDLEAEAKAKDEQIARHREQMNSVHSNKEYSALLVEVNTLKLDKGKLEDQALEQMTELDSLKQRQTELHEAVERQTKLVAQAEAEVAEAKAEVGDRLDEVSGQRDEAAQKIPADLLSTFNRLADAYEGEAMAGVEEQDRRRMEYNCGGCYISLPVEHVNTLMVRPEEVVTCPNCHRILFLADALKASLKPQ